MTIAIAVLLAALGLLLWMDGHAKAARVVPGGPAPASALAAVDSQREIYDVYRRDGVRGAKVVHLNRFLNLVAYLPREETVSTPFPIGVRDVRPLYERGLDAHSWLFIANRTGMVRSIVVILPGPVFEGRRAEFTANAAFTGSGGTVKGYTFDLPVTVTTLDAMPVIDEPVVVNVDAGYFGFGDEPEAVAALLREKCPDIRRIVLSASLDEPEVDAGARGRLKRFQGAWAGDR
jgi:hypothetical protein